MCRRSVQALLGAQRILCGFKNIFSLKMIGQLFTVRSPGCDTAQYASRNTCKEEPRGHCTELTVFEHQVKFSFLVSHPVNIRLKKFLICRVSRRVHTMVTLKSVTRPRRKQSCQVQMRISVMILQFPLGFVTRPRNCLVF